MTAARHARYDPRDVQPRHVLLGVAGLFALVATSAGVVAGMMALLSHDAAAPSAQHAARPRLGPPLEVDQGESRAALEAAARRRLETYGWVDRAKGRARIPIERAMQLLAQHGWPDDGPEGARR
ncbi:MAG: hypothetical protein ACOY4R_07080 [Pseudomonadota bacterium]